MRGPSKTGRKSPVLSGSGMAAVGSRIGDLRTRLDQTRQGFAAMLEVAPETVAMWESGRGLDHAALARIADRTDTTVEWLIAGFTPPELAAFLGRATGQHSGGMFDQGFPSGGSRSATGDRLRPARGDRRPPLDG